MPPLGWTSARVLECEVTLFTRVPAAASKQPRVGRLEGHRHWGPLAKILFFGASGRCRFQISEEEGVYPGVPCGALGQLLQAEFHGSRSGLRVAVLGKLRALLQGLLWKGPLCCGISLQLPTSPRSAHLACTALSPSLSPLFVFCKARITTGQRVVGKLAGLMK